MKIWYTLERANGIWTIWKNKERILKGRGGFGCSKVYSSSEKEDCLNYAEINKIKLKRGK